MGSRAKTGCGDRDCAIALHVTFSHRLPPTIPSGDQRGWEAIWGHGRVQPARVAWRGVAMVGHEGPSQAAKGDLIFISNLLRI